MKDRIVLALLIRVIVGCAVAAPLCGCGGRSSPPPIYIGHVAATTGQDRHAGEQATLGIRLAVQEQVKEAEKDQLRAIHVRHTDTRGNLQAYEGEAIRLVTVNRVIALLGGTTPAEVVRLDKAQVPLVAPCGFRSRDMSDWVYLTGLSPAFQGSALARFAAGELKIGEISVAADDRREEFLAAADSFADAFAKKRRDGKAPQKIWRFGKERPAPDVAKLLSVEKPKALLVAGASNELVSILGSISPRPAVVLFAGDDTGVRALAEAPDTSSVYLATAYAAGIDLPRAKDFAAAFSQAFNAEPDVNAVLAYDGARLLFEAIRRSNELTRDQIAKELGQLKDFPGLTGPLSFDSDRTLRRPAFIARLQKGKSQVVKTYDAAEFAAKPEK